MFNRIQETNSKTLAYAKELILNNQVVAFPTETVYGLGANALEDKAVENIFTLKGRPQDNPLIVHLHKEYDIEKLTEPPMPHLRQLIDKLAPGPITFILKSKKIVSNLVTANLDTVAIRIPNHPVAQAFLKEVDLPIAAPSANISTHTSPVTAQHVQDDFGDKLPLILDGGRSFYGLESTVCDITGEKPIILRQGFITADEIASIVGDCLQLSDTNKQEELKRLSPGTRYKHYAPNCKTTLFESNQISDLEKYAHDLQKNGISFAILAESSAITGFQNYKVYNLGNTAKEMASNLYMYLREAEKEVENLLVLLPIGQSEILQTVQNRLKKACGKL